MGNKIVITGGAGFIGSNFVKLLLEDCDYDEILIIDKLTYAGSLDNLDGALDNERVRFFKGDIAEPDDVARALEDARHVVNFAAETHVDRSLAEASPFIRSNIMGVHALMEKSREASIEKFVHISTDEVYGAFVEGSATEESPLNPSSPYSASKVAGDALCNAYRVSWGVPTVIVRPTNNYGPNQFPEKLIPFFVKRAMAGETLPIYGEGDQVRDWLFVRDNCRAIKLVLDRGEVGEIYNIGADCHRKNIDVARKMLEILDIPESRIEHVADRPGHDFRYAVDSTKIRELGWRPQTSWDEGFRETVLHFKEKFGGQQ
ncbi:MAG TPA: dTDP-glucose 4,6-dehydratase [candidate division Zixibacteria bacterium]|nr:dTDP-glucose 4,6-dehydratase [candidate division Zixibacteria bacterium]